MSRYGEVGGSLYAKAHWLDIVRTPWCCETCMWRSEKLGGGARCRHLCHRVEGLQRIGEDVKYKAFCMHIRRMRQGGCTCELLRYRYR